MPPANEGAAAKLLAVGEDDGDVLGGTENSTFAFLTRSCTLRGRFFSRKFTMRSKFSLRMLRSNRLLRNLRM